MKRVSSKLKAIGSFGAFATSSIFLLSSMAFGKSQKSSQSQSDKNLGLGSLWKTANIESSLTDAQRLGKNTLLYWGAVWCPPCNELKSQVFSKQEFQDATKNIQLVYLDGDSPDAQKWADKLKVSGYPSLLLLNSKGKEVNRFDGALSVSEFTQALQFANIAQSSVSEILNKFFNNQGLSKAEWQSLSAAAWDDSLFAESVVAELNKMQLNSATITENKVGLKNQFQLSGILLSLFEKAETDIEKSIFAAKLLLSVFDSEETSPEYQQAVAKKEQLLNAIFKSPETQFANRSFVLSAVKETIAFLEKTNREKISQNSSKNMAEVSSWKSIWLAAAQVIASHPNSSIDSVLWSHYPEIVFATTELSEAQAKSFSFTDTLKQKVINAVNNANKLATTDFLRKSVVTGASSLLSKIGEFEMARNLLQQELLTSTTPWYVQSAMGELEKNAGNNHEALRWFELAKNSAVGTSTKLQWNASYISNFVKMNEKRTTDQEKILTNAVNSYYKLAFSASDAFSGRNHGRQKKLADVFKSVLSQNASASQDFKYKNNGSLKQKNLEQTLVSLSRKCSSLNTQELRTQCSAHFASMGIVNPTFAKETKKNLN